MATIASTAKESIVALDHCLSLAHAVLVPQESTLIEDQLGRFSIWTSNMGVFAPSRASMDHRLREAPEILRLVIGLLNLLKSRAQDCMNVVQSVKDASSEHTDKPEVSSVQGRLQLAVQAIAAEISLLHQLSNTIRKAGRDSANLKAAAEFQIKDDEGTDLEPALKRHFSANIKDRFPGCSDTLLDRLASTMTLRRKRILYRRHRYGKAAIRPAEPVTGPEIQDHSVPQSAVVEATEATTDVEEDHDQLRPQESDQKVLKSLTQSATTLAATNYHQATSPSVVSGAKTIALGHHEGLAFPRPPQGHVWARFNKLKRAVEEGFPRFTGLHLDRYDIRHNLLHDKIMRRLLIDCREADVEVICPYCLYTLSSREVKDEARWRDHVRVDLEPYVCLADDCDKPYELYRHSEEWLEHMRRHQLRWQCKTKTHGVQLFDTRQAYEEHMRESHGHALTASSLSLLAERSTRMAGPIFQDCPLCGAGESSISGKMQDHVVGHLRFLALKSLPPVDEDIGSQSNGSDSKGTRSTVGDELTQAVPLEFEDAHGVASGAGDQHKEHIDPYTEFGGFLSYLANYRERQDYRSPTWHDVVSFGFSDSPFDDPSIGYAIAAIKAFPHCADHPSLEWAQIWSILAERSSQYHFPPPEEDRTLQLFLARRAADEEGVDSGKAAEAAFSVSEMEPHTFDTRTFYQLSKEHFEIAIMADVSIHWVRVTYCSGSTNYVQLSLLEAINVYPLPAPWETVRLPLLDSPWAVETFIAAPALSFDGPDILLGIDGLDGASASFSPSRQWTDGERYGFQELLASFGTDWPQMASYLRTKTAKMLHDYYRQHVDDIENPNFPDGRHPWKISTALVDVTRHIGVQLFRPPIFYGLPTIQAEPGYLTDEDEATSIQLGKRVASESAQYETTNPVVETATDLRLVVEICKLRPRGDAVLPVSDIPCCEVTLGGWRGRSDEFKLQRHRMEGGIKDAQKTENDAETYHPANITWDEKIQFKVRDHLTPDMKDLKLRYQGREFLLDVVAYKSSTYKLKDVVGYCTLDVGRLIPDRSTGTFSRSLQLQWEIEVKTRVEEVSIDHRPESVPVRVAFPRSFVETILMEDRRRGQEIGSLVLVVGWAKDLRVADRNVFGILHPYCAARLGSFQPDMRTKTEIRGGPAPRWEQALRFAVYDSSDYYHLKVSVFHDGEKPELIGETWVDLRDVLVHGGNTITNTHTLVCMGLPTGQIHLETTFLDSR